MDARTTMPAGGDSVAWRAADTLSGKIGILSLVPDVWGGPWTVRHQILTRLSKDFPVVWVDYAPYWRDAREESRAPTRSSPMPAYPGFRVFHPPRYLSEVHRPRFLHELIHRVRVRRAVAELKRMGAERIILYLWRPEFRYTVDLGNWSLVCYHIDDEYSFSETESAISPNESVLLQRSDLILIHSRALLAKKGSYNPNTRLVPNGVDFDAFRNPRPEPADMAGIPHPRIGYAGVIKKQLDLGLLRDIARQRPNWSLVLVGPVLTVGDKAPIIDELRRMPNVYLLGEKPVEELPAYVQHFDVGLLPYVVNDYTKFIYPLKLHEYFAAGLPSVGTPIPALQDFAHVLKLASSPAEWLAALDSYVAQGAPSAAFKEQIRAIAAQHDWNRLAAYTAGELRDHLARVGR